MTINKIILAAFVATMPTLALAEPPHSEGKPEVREALEKVRAKHPEKYDKLMKLRQENPKEFRHAMRRVMHHFGEGPDQNDPQIRAEKEKMRELRGDFKSALDEYNAADEGERTQLRKELVELAEEIFDAKQSHRRMRVEKMQKHLSELESEITERAGKRSELIEQFVDEKTKDSLKGL
jgi:hypothetical protein